MGPSQLTSLLSRKGEIRLTSGKPKLGGNLFYTLTRRYYTHGTYKLFRRIVIDIRGKLHIYTSNVGQMI